MIYPSIEFTPLPKKKIRVDCYCTTNDGSYRGIHTKGECVINGTHYFFKARCKQDTKNLVFSKTLENVSKVEAKFIYYAGLYVETIAAKSTFEWKCNSHGIYGGENNFFNITF